jgi:MOSC domain-containing protein YiiM
MEVVHIYISPGHNFFGHHGQPAGRNPLFELREVECVAGRGVRGDRFFEFKQDYKGQVTFFSWETYRDLCQTLHVENISPGVFRRNVITRGVELNSLIGKEFEIQGVRFLGVSECSPCYWMNEAFAPGAEKLLQGRGGLRARILSGGKLQATAGVVLEKRA